MLALDIVGIGCLLPDADTPQAFWDNLLRGHRSIRHADAADWGADPARWLHAGGKLDHTTSIEIAKPRDYHFDAAGYRLPADLLAIQDRCLQWPLAAGRDALRDAGLWPAKENDLRRIGVLLGSYAWAVGAATDAATRPYYEQAIAAAFDAVAPRARLRLAPGRPLSGTDPRSARIGGGLTRMLADALGLGGPRYSLDAACATSLYALRLAAAHIAAGEADAMLVVCASAFDSLYANLGFAATQALPDGAPSRPLDARSAGLAPGEGAIAMLVRRAEGRESYGVIRSIGLSSDGRGKTLTAPSAEGQKLACERAYQSVALSPASVDYVECHATGTRMGDRIELETMLQVFGSGQPIGAVKSNLGHLLTAAGAAGLLKILLAMRGECLPATVGVEQPLSAALDIIIANRAWPAGPRRAAVNAFGFGGVNAHLIVDAAPRADAPADLPTTQVTTATAVVSAADAPLLTGMAASIGDCADLAAVAQALRDGQPRWRPAPPGQHPGLPFATPAGAYLDRLSIDALRLRLPPNDLDRLSPSQPLMLSVGDQALRDAEIAPGSRTAVIVVASMDHSVHRLLTRWESGWRLSDALAATGLALPPMDVARLEQALADSLHQGADAVVALGYIGNLLASRIAAAWDFSGPAFTLSGDETTALRALHLGKQLLAEGEADAVLVGAVDLGGSIENLLVRHAHGGDISAPLAEGACAVVLEPATAVRARQGRAYAGWLAAGFAEDAAVAVERSRRAAGLAEQPSPGLLDLGAVDARARSAGLPSQGAPVMSDSAAVFGHGRMLAPLLGVVQVALALSGRLLPPWLEPDPAILIALKSGRAHAPAVATPWLRPRDYPRRAAVLAVDQDGAAAQAWLVEVPAALNRAPPEPLAPLLLALTGQDREALLRQLNQLIAAPTGLREACRQSQRSYDSTAPVAMALIGEDEPTLLREARAALAAITSTEEWQSPTGSRFSAAPLGREHAVAMVYSPLNTAFTGLARGAASLLSGSLDALEETHRDLATAIGAEMLYPTAIGALEPEPRMALEQRLLGDNSALVGAGVLSSWLYTRVLVERLGLSPCAIFGHSLGQLSMLFAHGVWHPGDTWTARLAQFDEQMRRLSGNKAAVREHWSLAEDAPLEWVNYLVLAPAADVMEAVAEQPRAYVSLINSTDELTLVGDRAACANVLTRLSLQAIPAPDSLVIHCPPARLAFDGIATMCAVAPAIPAPTGLLFAGGAPSAWTADGIATRIAEDLVSPLDFVALTERAYARGARIFLELGPGANCSRWIEKILDGRPNYCFALSRRDQDDAATLMRLLALLVAQRVPLDLARACRTPPAAAPSLPRELPLRRWTLTAELCERLRRAGLDHLLRDAAARRDAAAGAGTPPPAPPFPATLAAMPRPAADQAMSPPLTAALLAIAQRRAQAHRAYLDLYGQGVATVLGGGIESHHATPAIERKPSMPPLYDESAVMEFAEGRIAHVFGPAYADADLRQRRLRLPGPPFLALSRVLSMSGVHGQLHGSRICTEFDVPDPAWNAVDGQTFYFSMDAQGVLFLAGWLGMDALNEGRRVYRWLDATLTFQGPTPRAGECVRYDIAILESYRNGDALLFKTDFQASANGRPLLKIERCTAGFFSQDELARGVGIDVRHTSKRTPASTPFKAPLAPPVRALERADLVALARGESARVLSPAHANIHNPALRMPPPIMHMIDRIAYIQAAGGRCGLGRSLAELRIDPMHWAIRAHFKDDPVFPGPCMLEGAFQLLQMHALALGLGSGLRQARFQPVINRAVEVRFRAQVLPRGQIFRYRAEIIEIDMGSEPYLIADIDLLDEERIAGRIEGLGVRLIGLPADPTSAAPAARLHGVMA